MATLELQIEGMHCGACVRRVTQTINALPSTRALSVQVGAASVATEQPGDEQLLQALEQAGFRARVAGAQP